MSVLPEPRTEGTRGREMHGLWDRSDTAGLQTQRIRSEIASSSRSPTKPVGSVLHAWLGYQRRSPIASHLFRASCFLILTPLPTFPLGQGKKAESSLSLGVTVGLFCNKAWKGTTQRLGVEAMVLRREGKGAPPPTLCHLHLDPHLSLPTPRLPTLTLNILA